MTAPVDPVEGGGPVEEPVPMKDPAAPQTSQARPGSLQRGRPSRGWAIDTTPLRDPNYRRLFWGVAATMLGQQMTLVAVPFQVYALTGSSLLVGVTSIVALVPLVVFGLLGGAIADAMDRRRLMLITSVGAAVTSALLALQALLPGGGNLVLLWILAACVSGFAAVNQPTRSAVIPAIVGPAAVPAANALAMTVRQAGVIVGPLLAGVLIGLGELFLAYAIDALGFLVAALLLRGPIEDGLFDGSGALYWILVVAVLAYAASYFARGWLAGHQWFGLYGGLVFLEATS
ncbi:MAG TPA: MFS transporter, partial [Blastococcus sp.]|nr:MFS transporter [Blastococcus sp.]